MSHQEHIASHGRGGAGNIAPDDNTYVDGSITREGPFGDQGGGAYSTGVCISLFCALGLQLPRTTLQEPLTCTLTTHKYSPILE